MINVTNGSKIGMEIMVRLANALFTHHSIKKIHLYFYSRTNWHSFERHMDLLIKNGHVECKTIEKDEGYFLTESGREVLEHLLKFHEKIRKNSSVIQVL
ncbi:hypothetical protein NUZ5A_51256 [Candidatus Nitrosotenuis uzonensis]|uniref:ArnR1-like winged helix-turn-helix domain-containing protein n=2 Tax=Candidatus Nitrosotenuis uzonensis TaxID=1407055 RepID=A0A812EZF9_9ARCH|nr:hypothetical protein NUZ5A_51256 [Candidatus Nitrosotenuis uzonensis]